MLTDVHGLNRNNKNSAGLATVASLPAVFPAMKLALLLWMVLATTPLYGQVRLTAAIADRAVPLNRSTVPAAFHDSAAVLAPLVRWQPLRPGLETAEFTVEAGRLGMNVRIVLARVDPGRFDFELVRHTEANRMTGAWNVDVAPQTAAVALNAGQFKESGPWGWLVMRGFEERDPGYGPLSAGIAIDTAGRFRWIDFKDLRSGRRDRSIRFAFQSYPTLLLDRRVPRLARDNKLVDQNHRDARLILGEDGNGRLLIVLTRYDAMRGAVSRIPIGLTVPESIALLGALGARHAVMLDGGVSAQLLLRGDDATHVWRGMRNVPLALIATPRAH
jgi:hypothetical protein